MQLPATVVDPARGRRSRPARPAGGLRVGVAAAAAAAAAATLVLLAPIALPWPPGSPNDTGPGAATLRVSSTPSGATVEVDGRARGTTPLDLAVAPGEHRLRFGRPGYADTERTVTATTAAAHLVSAELWLRAPRVQRLRPTFPGAQIVDAAFLADGRVALTVALPPGDERQAWLLDVGGAARRIGPTATTTALALAPDGRRFAYLARPEAVGPGAASLDGRASELWVGERDGERGRRAYALPPGAADERLVDLAWAPDGRRLLLVSRLTLPAGGTRSRLLWLDTVSGAVRELALLPTEVVPGGYAWAPDGERFALLARAGQLTSLCLVDPAEPGVRYLADLTRDDAAPLSFPSVAWAPDGRLVYAAPTDDRSASSGWLFGPRPSPALFALTGVEPAGRRLGGAEGQSPIWRHDGSLVALARPKGDGALVLRSYDAAGEARTVAELPLKAPGVYGARWDVAHAQAIVALRAAATFGASRAEYWLVRFDGEPEP